MIEMTVSEDYILYVSALVRDELDYLSGINAWVEFDAKVENAQKIAKLTMA